MKEVNKNFKNRPCVELNHRLQLALVISIIFAIIFIQNIQAVGFGSRDLSIGETWNLGDGFSITAQSIDAKAVPKQVWLVLSDSGTKLDDKILAEGNEYNYNNIFITTVANIWSEPTGDKVRLTNTFTARYLPTTQPPTVLATTAAPTVIAITATAPKFRVGPSITLRPVTDVIDTNQDGIVELFMNNPSLNDVTLNVDVRVSVPSGIHVSGEGFEQAAGTGVVAGTFSVPPGTARTITIVIKADKSARIGSHTLQFTGLYWPGDNKDNFQPLSLTYPVTVKEPTIQVLTPTKTPIAVVTMPYQFVPSSGKPETSWLMIGGLGLLILLGIIAIYRLRQKDKPTKVAEKIMFDKKLAIKDINITSAFGYKGATILYKVKVENTSPAPIADIKVSLFVPNVFLLLEKEKSLALLKPGESKTVTFDIRPTGECGDCEVSGKVVYYDTASNRTKETDIESKMLSIVCPMLKVKEISESDWQNTVSNLLETEENTKEIDMSAETLFNMTSRIIKDMHMHMLKPEVTQDQKLFNGVARFYCEGIKGLHYAAQIEVVGGARKSKLILKAWAEKEDALTGFYHGVLDEIEKRVKVKEYIDDSIVQYNVHIGDKIGTLVKDSVVQRSTIGASSRKCPDCGREVEANEKFCLECGAKV